MRKTVLVLVGFLLMMFCVNSKASDTILSFRPMSQTVAPGGSFTVDVYCAPGQPIKAFEFRLLFDASLIQANEVTEGHIFDGYPMFFNKGVIDNVAGRVINVYGLILGLGTVSNPGAFATISFTAQSIAGTSKLEFLDVGTWTGVTNETGYVPIDVYSGSVTVKEGYPPMDEGTEGFPIALIVMFLAIGCLVLIVLFHKKR